jgi:hypothetical protein
VESPSRVLYTCLCHGVIDYIIETRNVATRRSTMQVATIPREHAMPIETTCVDNHTVGATSAKC